MGLSKQSNDLVIRNLGVSGDLVVADDATVDGDVEVGGAAAVTGAVTGASFNGVLAGVTAPIELAEAAVEAGDIWTALAALGLIVEPEE